MNIKRPGECREITAGDGTRLRELLHPARDEFAGRYSLALARLGPGARSRPHRLQATEVYFIVAGNGVMHVDSEAAAVGPGDAVYIPAGSRQWIEAAGAGELVFACIVDPAWRAGDESVENDGPGHPGPS